MIRFLTIVLVGMFSIGVIGCIAKVQLGPLGYVEPFICVNSSIKLLKRLSCETPLIDVETTLIPEDVLAGEE